MPKLKKTGEQLPSIGDAMAEVAAKATKLSKMDLQGVKKAKEEQESKKPKPLPSPNASKWLKNIERSKKVRKPFVDDADRFLRMYQGDYNVRPGKRRNDDKMSVNIVYSHVEIVTPAVFSGFPEIRVRPKPKVGESAEAAETRARNMELVINYWFKELAVDEELRDVFLDTFFGMASTEVGWETEIEEEEELTEDENDAEVSLGTTTVIKDRPFVIRRDLRSVFLDPDARRRKDVSWIAVEDVIPYNEFLASSKFTDYAKKKVKPQLYPCAEEDKAWMGRENGADTSEKSWVQLFTIWDKTTRRKYVVTPNCDRYLNSDGPEGEPWPYELEYKDDPFPICIHDAKRDKMSPYSWSEFKAYEPQILELNRIRQAIHIHVKRSLPKYVYTDAAGEKQDIQKLMNARSDEATKLNNLDAFRSLENAEIPGDLWNFNNMAKDDLLNVSGLFEYQNQSVADTATEASLIEGRSQVRKTMRSRLWEQYVVEIAAKLAQLCQQNMDEAIAIQIAGEQGVEWLHVDKTQIQGEFFFDIEPGIMEYKNESLRKQQLLKYMELAGNNPNTNQRGLLKTLAKEFDMTPEDVVLPEDQLPPAEPPKPTITFKPIDPSTINDSTLMNAVVMEALKQNGVEIGELAKKIAGVDVLGANQPMDMLKPGAPEGGPGQKPAAAPAGAPAPGGKDLATAGANPNGNPSLPPVQGNLNLGGNPNG